MASLRNRAKSYKLRTRIRGSSLRPPAKTGRRVPSRPVRRVHQRVRRAETGRYWKTGRVLRNLVLFCMLITLACGARGGATHGLHQEATATTRAALSCVTGSAIAALPAWTVGNSYNLGDEVQFGGQAFACRQPTCLAQVGWEPGSPGLLAIWQAAPSCGLQPWAAGVAYDAGAIVSFNGQLFDCITAHTSQTDWTPDVTPTLWQPFDPAQGAGNGTGDPNSLTPNLNCVLQQGSSPRYSAVFGYTNASTATVIVPIGTSNGFDGGQPARGQPTAYAAGVHDGAFVVDFDGSPLTWTLGQMSATASASSPMCQTTPSPDGPVVHFPSMGTAPPILVQPDPAVLLPANIVATETTPSGAAVGTLPGEAFRSRETAPPPTKFP
jgi:Carbohydrate-binding module family 5/12